MIATVSPSQLNGELFAPSSKSAMQRACALALMNNGSTTISNPGMSNDDKAAQEIVRQCGAKVFYESGKLRIESDGFIKPAQEIHCGESGLSVRMFTPIMALGTSMTTLTGEGSLLSRPMNVFENVLQQLGVTIRTNDGFLPMVIKGPLAARDCVIDGSKSSQYVTGILFALAKSAEKQLSLTVSNLTSRPYVDLSLQMLEHFGYMIENNAYETFIIQPVENVKRNIEYTTEGDWSAAAFLLVAAAIAGREVFIKGIDSRSKQADKAILDVLQQCGACFRILETGVKVDRNENLLAFNFDATHCPDLFPPLVALAAFCKGESVIIGTSRLITKESNRLTALIDVFTKMGVQIKAQNNTMFITGNQGLRGETVDGHNDHRIVMACAVAALRSTSEMKINGVEAINKSYPEFFNDLQLLGANVSLTDN